MQTNQKNKNKQLQSELEITKAELEHYRRNPDSDPTFVLSKHNDFIKCTKTNMVFELRHENALSEIFNDMPCLPHNIPQFIDYALEDITDHALATMHKDDYMQHRKLLQGIKIYFKELFVEQKQRPKSHE